MNAARLLVDSAPATLFGMIALIRMRMLIASFAIRAFQLETGRLPVKLAELIPDYLNAIPVDPYSNGDTFKYTASGDGFVLYSMGPNQIDDGGISPPKGATGQSGGDLTNADQFPAPKKQPARATNSSTSSGDNGGTND